MITATVTCLCALLISCAAAVWRLGRAVERLPEMIDARIAHEAAATRDDLRTALEHESAVWRSGLRDELRASRHALIAEARAMRADILQLADYGTRELLAALNARTEEIVLAASTALADATTSMQETANAYAAMARSSERAVELLTPQALGTVAAAKVAAGQIAQAARTWQRASPEIAENVRRTTEHARETTSAARLLPGAIIGAIVAALVALATK